MTQATAPEGYPRSLYTLFMPRESPGLFPTHSNAPDSYLVAYIDGGARGNPGPAGYGAFIKDQSGNKVAALSKYLGRQTNNYAEYNGLLAALEYARSEEHTSELQSRVDLVCRLLLEKKKMT